MKIAKRTVAALLNVKVKGIMNRFRYRKQPRHTYIYCKSKNIARMFLENAEAEGFTFGDGVLPTARETSDIFSIHPDYTLCYVGYIGHIMFKNSSNENLVRIDYGKYLSGASDFIM